MATSSAEQNQLIKGEQQKNASVSKCNLDVFDFDEQLEFFLKENYEEQIIDLARSLFNKSLTEESKKECFEKLNFICHQNENKNDIQNDNMQDNKNDNMQDSKNDNQQENKNDNKYDNNEKIKQKAYFLLGLCYIFAFGTSQNLEKAVFYFKLASKYHCPYGLSTLGNCYLDGVGVTKNKDTGLKLQNLADKHGHPYAAAIAVLGKGDTIEESDTLLSAFTNAANIGYSGAQMIAGLCHLRGALGFKKNPMQGLKLLELAAAKGFPMAKYELAMLYEQGEIVGQDLSKALTLFQEAAETYSTAMIKLGNIYQCRKSNNPIDYKIEKDLQKGFELFSKASERNDRRAFFVLGHCYEWGMGVEKDSQKAFLHYQKGAELNHIDCLWALGRCYAYGFGTNQDTNEAVKIYIRLLKHKYTLAADISCLHFRIGQLLLPDKREDITYQEAKDTLNAVKHLKLASLYQDGFGAEAQSKLAECYMYREGIGVYANPIRAILLKMSALKIRENVTDRKTLNEWLATKMFADHPKTLSDCIKFYDVQARNDVSYSKEIMGFCYHYGLGVERNPDKAKDYYRACIQESRFNVLWDLLDLYCSLEPETFDMKEAFEYFNKIAKNPKHAPDLVLWKELEASRILMYIHQNGLLGQAKSVWKSCQLVFEKMFKIDHHTLQFYTVQSRYNSLLFEGVLSHHKPKTSTAHAKFEEEIVTSNLVLFGFKNYIKHVIGFDNLDDIACLITEYALELPEDLKDLNLTINTDEDGYKVEPDPVLSHFAIHKKQDAKQSAEGNTMSTVPTTPKIAAV